MKFLQGPCAGMALLMEQEVGPRCWGEGAGPRGSQPLTLGSGAPDSVSAGRPSEAPGTHESLRKALSFCPVAPGPPCSDPWLACPDLSVTGGTILTHSPAGLVPVRRGTWKESKCEGTSRGRGWGVRMVEVPLVLSGGALPSVSRRSGVGATLRRMHLPSSQRDPVLGLRSGREYGGWALTPPRSLQLGRGSLAHGPCSQRSSQ